MNISDSIQFLMLLVAAIAIVVSSVMSQRAIKASMEQSKIQTFAEYTKRFQDILMAMPKSVYDGSDTIDNDVLRFMELYFNLCSEEYYLHTKGTIDDVWDKWLTGIKLTMKRNVYQKAWQMESYNYNKEFVSFMDGIIKEAQTS